MLAQRILSRWGKYTATLFSSMSCVEGDVGICAFANSAMGFSGILKEVIVIDDDGAKCSHHCRNFLIFNR